MSKARTAASGMRRRAHRQGAAHGAAQLTFDEDEVKEDREEEVGLHTGGARTHLACCGRLRANPIQLPRKPLLARQFTVGAWRLLPGRQSQHQLCSPHFAAAALIVERAGMPLDAAGR